MVEVVIVESIKVLRRGKGCTQEQLANAVGVKRAVISKYESGMVSPSYDMMKKIAAALSVPISELLDTPFEKLVSSERLDIYIDSIRDHLLPLNDKGREKVADFAVDYSIDLDKIPEYKKNPPEAPQEAPEGE